MSTRTVLLADENGFHPALGYVFDMKYPTTLVDGSSPLIKKYQPLDFHTRHLDPFLSIKYVKPLGFSISEYLSEFCDKEIMDFVRKEGPLKAGLRFRPTPPVQKKLSTAYDVANYYVQHIADTTTGFPSRLYLRPSDEHWNTFIYVSSPLLPGKGPEIFRQPAAMFLCRERQMIRFRPPPSDEFSSEMKRLREKYSELAVYEFYDFSQTARRLLEDMGRQEGFEWTTPGTRGYLMDVSPRESPPDGTAGIWSKISSIERRPSKTSTKRSKGRSRMKKTVLAAVRKGTRGRPYSPIAKDFLQKAWLHAVAVDATFLVFHCGKAERIGFRHRETQTLYLSELIDPSAVEKYAKIQTGLHLAIVKDVLERDVLSSTKKRPAAEPINTECQSKRVKRTHETEDVDSNPSAELSLGSRNLALIALDQGLYRSPVPSSFFRVESTWDPARGTEVNNEPRRKARYPPSEYFTLTLGDQLGRGSVGIAYQASVTFISESNTFEHSRLVVKMSYFESQKTSLRHEYAMYKLLVTRGVAQNILPVYGMFQDAETGMLVLVMEYGGESLSSRDPEGTGRVPFTEQERMTITYAFRKLHARGILHGDIRLNNLLMDSSGAVYIIDFDRAEVDPEEKQLQEEMDELAGLLGNGDEDNDDDEGEDLHNSSNVP
ncbi:hypothetical protein M413DRAFT_28883 [Hebeloma cylindrosporum]|uniref:Protein kinase domain-containing protein n=1 Tax=Hebeloma cylindrosporum TaxID=76867 RepID=A0A0C3C9Z2_HEBCY|nr:hypothetical protein M413DRAFT_28883 [Hebeloma cylindrosporum h7]